MASLYVGMVTKTGTGRLIYIYDGQFMSNGKLSNFWYWKYINDDGTLGRKGSGYGWGSSKDIKFEMTIKLI
jgi:hypothetical protein